MRVAIGIKEKFDAAHRIASHDGKCKDLHGHTYIVEVEVIDEVDQEKPMVIDFITLKKIVRNVLQKYDHKYLNEVLNLSDVTVEILALSIFNDLKAELAKLYPGTVLRRVRVYESLGMWAEVVE
ncbi:MAG: 6-carboxytetrahydropterin synthase QueD [Ignisphaera sp.]